MKDPIGSFETIKENFIRYVETAFATKFEKLNNERYQLLNRDKVFYRKPWIEPLPDYISSNKQMSDLSLEDLGNALNPTQAQTFKELVNTGLFPANIKMHSHQAIMLKEALSGNNCIITSGTGSGKTESFLLPLFAQLAKEFTDWPATNTKSPSVNTWWKERSHGGLTPSQIVNPGNFTLSNAVRQRQHETRKAAVRALILYPMNALVEDQMSRLRKALDSDDTRRWLSTHGNGNSIYFGRYNGSSPVAGELKRQSDTGLIINKKKVEQLRKELNDIETGSNVVANYIEITEKNNEEAKELKSFFQRLDGAEMRCRFDMQVAPPDILITNYSMLSIMLMRDIDSGIFEETRQWLAAEDLPEADRGAAKQDRIFHLIIDELHLYRGTQGTEVAYLLRLVLHRLGLQPEHMQLRILASSASLESNDENSKKFVCDFFGVSRTHFDNRFKLIEGQNNPVDSLLPTLEKLPIEPFAKIAQAFSDSKGNIAAQDFITACDIAGSEIASAFKINVQSAGIEKLLFTITDPILQLKERLFAPCPDYKAVCSIKAEGDDSTGPYFAETIFETTNSQADLQNALRGLLIARSLIDEVAFQSVTRGIPDARKLPRFRFHYFFRNIEGLWASVLPDDIDFSENKDAERTAGKLYSTTRINSEKGNRVLELLYCDNCGTTLFGGSRLVTRNTSGNHSFELLPISPNIEGIPEKTPAKLVEKRSYQEFAVFWPCGNQPLIMHDREPGVPVRYWRQMAVNGFDQNLYESSWQEASINFISGDIDFTHDKANTEDSWIKGYYFMITENGSQRDISLPDAGGNIDLRETHRALPCVCPACGLNHQRRNVNFRKRKFTSIRGFRTGFAKTTQIFAKELIYQLPQTEKDKKLVVFSDSREDAAQIADGIERHHYTDLLREILVNELHTSLMLRHKMISAFDADDTERKQNFESDAKAIYDEIDDLFDKSNYSGNNSVRLKEKEQASAKLSEYRSLMINARELVHITNSVNLAPLIRRFVKLGINPGGNDISIQSKELNNSFVPWYQLIDFVDYQWKPGISDEFISQIKEGTYTTMAGIFFGSLFYSFESSALGFLSINPDLPIIGLETAQLNISRDEFLQIVNSTIRVLGDKYKHNKAEDGIPFNPLLSAYSEFPGQVKKYIRAVAARYLCNENDIGDAIFRVISSTGMLTADTGIQIENLFIKVARPTDAIWSSQRNGKAHLHFSGGICTSSGTPLNTQPDRICDDIWNQNYLSYNAIKELREPMRLHCEELTGQTDDQFERQRHFRNVVLPGEGEREVKIIDLLSVTTTLEVGVDIGSLQAVMLGNMPPQRFNYQQRVGRAGRRGQAYSIVLTFCRGRSHDEFYFSSPHKITGDAPPTPFLTMGQERIFKRLLAKELLREAYIDESIDISNDEKSSVHGEFGKIGTQQLNWINYKSHIQHWIETNLQKIENVVDSLLNEQLRSERAVFVNWITNVDGPDGMLGKIQQIINNDEIVTTDISEKLAEGGILPMFGMPTTVRNMYHGINSSLDPLAIDRPQSMAIYEFAPGAQKTKDKAVHQVIGFTSDIINTRIQGVETITNVTTPNQLPFSMNRWFIRCRTCSNFETYSEQEKQAHEAQNYFNACPNCGEVDQEKYQPPRMLKSPIAYRTNFSAGYDSKEDTEVLLSRPPIFAEKKEDVENPDFTDSIENTALTISDKDVTWRINTNSDKFFEGRLYNIINRFPFNSTTGYRFNDQWILNDFAGDYNSQGYSMTLFNNAAGQDEQIALASSKKTEILRIAPINVPLSLDLNMFASATDPFYIQAQSFGVRSGYYSAAFLLQRVLADKLDIDPAEIEVADIAMKRLEDDTERKVAEIILTDELPNGSGFVRYLFNNFSAILFETIHAPNADDYLGKIHSSIHQAACKDACYDCLKVYRNMNYHSLLDWRLGLSMMRIMSDENYSCGADGEFDSYVELKGWLSFATIIRNSFAQSFGYSNTSDIRGLPIIKWGRDHKNVIMIIHPFWNVRNMLDTNWLTEVKAEIDSYIASKGGTLSIIDTFNLHRRPGWCYEKLIIR